MSKKIISVALCICLLLAVFCEFASADGYYKNRYWFGTDPDAKPVENNKYATKLDWEVIKDGNGYLKMMSLKAFDKDKIDEEFISKHFSKEEQADIIYEDEASDKDKKDLEYGYKKYGFLLDPATSKAYRRDDKIYPIIKINKFSRFITLKSKPDGGSGGSGDDEKKRAEGYCRVSFFLNVTKDQTGETVPGLFKTPPAVWLKKGHKTHAKVEFIGDASKWDYNLRGVWAEPQEYLQYSQSFDQDITFVGDGDVVLMYSINVTPKS